MNEKKLPGQPDTKPDVLFLTVTMVVNPRQGVTVIITDTFPDIYLVRFKLTGRVRTGGKRAGTFYVDLVEPLDGYPHLTKGESTHLIQSLNTAALAQVERPVSTIVMSMIDTEHSETLSSRKCRLPL